MKKQITLFCAITFCAVALADAPTGYYSSAEGKKGEALRTALQGIIDNHTVISYNDLEEYYPDIDARKDNPNLVWDIYSTCEFTFSNANCQQKAICECWNKEHTVPQSWFNKKSPMKSDLFHVLPTDARVNNYRSNYAYGEVSDHTSLDGSKYALGWRSGKTFEPADEFKGDIARIYFYMATRYANQCESWGGGMFGSAASGFTTSIATMLMKWARNDAVSEKETLRNDAVYKVQKNRNPFVDHPELAEYIWGDKKGQAWYSNGSTAIKTSTIAGLEIYPNPAKDFVTVTAEIDEISYSIVSLSGQTFAQGNITSGQTISLESLQTGVYLLKISADGRQQIEKLLITK